MSTARSYGWRPDLPDHRDHQFAAPPLVAANLPAAVDLRPGCPPVWDQGQLGSCTAHAIGAAMAYDHRRQQLGDIDPSRLFIYYNERAMEGTIGVDAGAMIRDGVKSVAQQGVCPESLWPYDATRFAARPTPTCYQAARSDRAVSYRRVAQTLGEIRGCLASGVPVVFGFAVYESFESAAVAHSGVAPLPAAGERALGGHAVMAVGYDDRRQRFLVRNSWGAGWGQEGYFSLPYTYLLSRGLSADFWAITVVN